MKTGAAVGAVLLVLAQAVAFAAEEKTVVYNFDGKVSVVRNRKTLLVDFDMPILEGDVLRTEPESFIDLAMNGVAGVRALPSTECTIVNTNPSDMHIRLASGGLMANVKNPQSGGGLIVETPSIKAIMEEAGQFYVVLIPAKDKLPLATKASVKSGRMDVYAKQASATLSVIEGRTVEVPLTSSIPSLRNMSEEEDLFLAPILSIYVSD